jgi:hypothetical protein
VTSGSLGCQVLARRLRRCGLGVGRERARGRRIALQRRVECRHRSANHLDDIAIVADIAEATVHLAKGPPIEPEPVPGGNRQIELVGCRSTGRDRTVDLLLSADLAALLQLGPDRAADIGRILVGRDRDANISGRAGRTEQIAPAQIEIGDPVDHLVLAAPISGAVPSARLIARASAALPLRNKPAIPQSRALIWRMVVRISGCASLGSARRRISIESAASIACAWSRSPMPPRAERLPPIRARALMTEPLETCQKCQNFARAVWPPSAEQPAFSIDLQQGWLKPLKCSNCGATWMVVPYEPYASFTYLVRWMYSANEWLAINGLDDGKTLCQWADAQIKAAWSGMDEKDRSAIEHHRQRSFGRSPVDQNSDEPTPDLDTLLDDIAINAKP